MADCTPNATWEDWYNVGSNTIPFVDIDTTGDGLPGFEVRGTKLAGTDVLVAATVNLHAPPDSPQVQVLPVNGQYGDVDSGVFDSSVIVLPVSLTALGIDPLAATAPTSIYHGSRELLHRPGEPRQGHRQHRSSIVRRGFAYPSCGARRRCG